MREKEDEGGDHPIRFGRRFLGGRVAHSRSKQAAFKRMKERQALNHARGGRNWKEERDGNHKASEKEEEEKKERRGRGHRTNERVHCGPTGICTLL